MCDNDRHAMKFADIIEFGRTTRVEEVNLDLIVMPLLSACCTHTQPTNRMPSHHHCGVGVDNPK